MKSICVVADAAGNTHAALSRAIPLAQESKSNIEFIGFVYVYDLERFNIKRELDVGQAREEIMNRRHLELEDAVKKLCPKTLKVSVQVLWGKDLNSLLADYLKSDRGSKVGLLIKSGNRSESLLHTATDQKLIRQCAVPVMIVREKTWKKRATILAAIDLGTRRSGKLKLNNKVLVQAAEIAQLLQRELHCVYVIRVSPLLTDMDLIDPSLHRKRLRDEAAPALQELQEKYAIDPSNCHVVLGEPARRIPSVANKIKADLVVMGTVGRGGVKAALLGNTAEATLRKLHTDVLTLRP